MGKSKGKLNWVQRLSPTDEDAIAPSEVSYEFDYTHAGGASGWPTHHQGVKFGPALIKKAWAAGLVVYAVIEGFPHPIAVKEARWSNNTLTVETLEGKRWPTRLFTRPNVRGMTTSGELIESPD